MRLVAENYKQIQARVRTHLHPHTPRTHPPTNAHTRDNYSNPRRTQELKIKILMHDQFHAHVGSILRIRIKSKIIIFYIRVQFQK